MERKVLEVRTARCSAAIAAVERGGGEAVLFLHGWAHSSAVWGEVISRLPSDVGTIAIDWPGFGESPALDRANMTLDRYAELLWGLLAEISRRTKLRMVVADSMSGLLVLDCLSRFESAPASHYFLSGCPLDGLPRLIRNTQAHAFTGAGLHLLRALPPTWAHALTSRSNHLTISRRGEFERTITQMVRTADPSTAGAFLRQMYRPYELSDQFQSGRYALTLCRGSEDQIFRRNALGPWARALGATPVELEGLGHTPMLEGPDEYAEAIVARLG